MNEIINKITDEFKKIAAFIHDLFVNLKNVVMNIIFLPSSKRIKHLYEHAKKERVRKKNYHRALRSFIKAVNH